MKTRAGDTHTHILEQLQASGARVTNARKQIISVLVSAQEPLAIQDMVLRVSVDEVSVYRVVALLKKLRLVEEIIVSGIPTRYALSHGHHHHIVCGMCGHTVHIPCTKETFASVPSHLDFDTIGEHTVTYDGVCTKCAA